MAIHSATSLITHITTRTPVGALGRIDAVISDELEKKLRLRAVEKFGGKKGSLTLAVEEALRAWVGEEKKR